MRVDDEIGSISIVDGGSHANCHGRTKIADARRPDVVAHHWQLHCAVP